MSSLFNTLFGTKQGAEYASPMQTNNNNGQDWNALMGQLQANPAEMIRKAGYNVPDELSGNPQASVMHLLRTGQIGGPMMQRIMPMLNRMGVK